MMISYMAKIDYETIKILVADSSALVALAKASDSTHPLAHEVVDALSEDVTIVVAAEIFSETLNVLWKKVDKETAIKTGKDLVSSSRILIPETTMEIRREALTMFQNLRSKMINFTDCIVMIFAKKYGTSFILGFDEGFKKNGFKRLGID